MDALRKVGIGASSVFFCIFLALAVIPLGLYRFTAYDNLAPLFGSIVNDQISGKLGAAELSIVKQALLFDCRGKGSVDFPVSGQTVNLDCSEIKNTAASEIPSLVGVAMFKSVYYKEYDCNFIDCLDQAQDEQKFFLIVSEKGHEYYLKLTYYLFTAAAFFLILLGLVSKRWSKIMNPGICMLIVGLNYFFLNYFKANMTPEGVPEQVSSVIFSSFSEIFLYFLIIGAVLTALGIALNLIFKKPENPLRI